MLIDNEKFIGLLVENSGIEKEKVESYLEELIADIKTAFDEDEGYEVEGFGIFSKLGANVLFIPSEELETEINYKYVGMEPIELPGGEVEEPEAENEVEENPIQGILDGEEAKEEEEYEDPFAELFNEAEEHENQSEETESEEIEEDEIEAAVEEEIENEELEDIFSETSEDQEEEDEDQSVLDEVIEESVEIQDDSSSVEDEESKEAPGPDEWGISAHQEEDQENAFSGLLGDAKEEEPELLDEDDIFGTKEETDSEEEEAQEDEEIDFSALEEDIEEDDFDDPFASLEEEGEEEEEDFVPVVTNVSSGKASKETEEKEADDELAEEPKEKTKPKKPLSPRDRKQSSPVFLYMILALVVLGGTGYMLAYFGIINIEGITPSEYRNEVAQTTPPVKQPESTPPQTIQPEEQQEVRTPPDVADNTSGAEEESPVETNDSSVPPVSEAQQTQANEEVQNTDNTNDRAPLIADEKAPGDGGMITPVSSQEGVELYGLKGTVTQAGNNGYTIVLYTLSRKSGADAQFEKLSKDGYRAMIKEKPSTQYGALYRVSIGQFKTLADAAIAAEKVDPNILGNYIITKI